MMKPISFSIHQHLICPFGFPAQDNITGLAFPLREKVAVLALAILTAFSASFLVGALGAGLVGMSALYGLTGYRKIQILNDAHRRQKEENKLLADRQFSQQTAQGNLTKEETQNDAKTHHSKFCFIKSNTAPFSIWLEKEYPAAQISIQKNNLLYLQKTCPEINEGLFVSIRGDGDCTFRSIGVGLILQAILKESKASIKELLNQLTQIVSRLERDAKDLDARIQEILVTIENERKGAQQAEKLIDQHPERYRLANDYLNTEGQEIKDTLNEKRDIAVLLEGHMCKLQNPKNQKRLQQQIDKLKHAEQALQRLFSQQIGNGLHSSEICQKTIELMEREEFDQELVIFLRNASAINMALHMGKMGRYVKQLGNQEQVVSGKMSVFDLILQRANVHQPNQEYLQGTLNDAMSLSMLFEQPINWYRCEVYYEPMDRVVYRFGNHWQKKKQLYILNRPGHSDLIFV